MFAFQIELHKLDQSIRRKYDQAMEVAPVLVKKEAKMIDFLCTENNNPAKAAL